MDTATIINIQKCCVHDGPGIRTTIFFKGCPLNCWWCHNPESQNYEKEIMYNEEKCSKCGVCIQKCSNNCISIKDNTLTTIYDNCTYCETCVDFCINSAREIVGKEFNLESLMKEIEKDKIFYEQSGGGVTLSGGEVMTQIDFVEPLVKACHRKGISVAIDTCGHAPFQNYEKIIEYVDVFLYDIKLIDSQMHQKYTGKSNYMILDNLKKLSEKNANINLRIPLIDGINADHKNINEIINFIRNLNIKNINLLPYHEIGKDKYNRLGLDYKGHLMKVPSDEKLKEFKSLFEQYNFEVKIGG
jgi:pyruvate formate lyase activating enzyme